MPAYPVRAPGQASWTAQVTRHRTGIFHIRHVYATRLAVPQIVIGFTACMIVHACLPERFCQNSLLGSNAKYLFGKFNH